MVTSCNQPSMNPSMLIIVMKFKVQMYNRWMVEMLQWEAEEPSVQEMALSRTINIK